jgi:SAM-dependent methyltransferase
MDHEQLRSKVMASMQGVGLLHLAYVGIAGELLVALQRLGRGTAPDIASAAGRDPGYVTRWCDAAFAFELLSEVDDGVFELSPLGQAFLPETKGTLMPFAVGAVLGAHMAERATGLMLTGERPGESVLAERETILPWFGPMLEAQFGPFFDAHIVDTVPAFREVDARGGTVVDLGCGNGWYLRRLAARHGALRGIGLDGFAQNVDAATRAAAAAGMSDRLAFHIGDVHEFTVDEPVDLIALNRALHHVWNDKENVFRILREHLTPSGWAVIWEPAWPAARAALRAPAMRPMAFQNLAEHVQGNHFLRPEEVAEQLDRAGFDPAIHLFAEGREAVVTGRKRG